MDKKQKLDNDAALLNKHAIGCYLTEIYKKSMDIGCVGTALNCVEMMASLYVTDTK